MHATGTTRTTQRRLVLPLILALLPLAVDAADYALLQFKGIGFRVYRVEPAALRLHWRDPATGQPYRRFATLAAALTAKGERVAFMMNAGIFEPGCVPTGLHVEDGRQLHPLNLKNGDGNFFLKPNGVFGIDADGKAFVLESRVYAAARLRPRLAVQSGPLLLQDGRIHPAFSPDSPNHRHRNGVGVDAAGRVVFVCTASDQQTYATLYQFAEFFAQLGCRHALFLDGDLSCMLVDPTGPIDVSNDYAAIFTVAADPTDAAP